MNRLNNDQLTQTGWYWFIPPTGHPKRFLHIETQDDLKDVKRCYARSSIGTYCGPVQTKDLEKLPTLP